MTQIVQIILNVEMMESVQIHPVQIVELMLTVKWATM